MKWVTREPTEDRLMFLAFLLTFGLKWNMARMLSICATLVVVFSLVS